ncbi:Methyltransferase domain-containing protein [Micromonospora matsumotoense]|uniref:site-specific DNA-methyltransferase (adenine-specific) n=1 Tax=Micromonospora matsumotoense TaxID=121616 RepID=A0A1C4VUU1_9ACTN|nr:DNA methyltransferase [Micromonospora matsumotoense]SCE87743.1 Methyltransferase domain-containing protein [Micromonospora matsumotoense]
MSATARNQVFTAVHTIGGLLPADMLVRIAEGKDVTGTKPADYRVVGARSVRDDAERHWEWLKSVWKDLRGTLPAAPEADTPADPTGRAVTQWLAPLFDAFGFGALTPIGATGITSDDGGKTFPISHRWQHVPIHLAPWNATLDKRPAGGGTVPPQSLVQECLNRSDVHLWGVLTNGRQLRLLRDSNALATAAYVEFDLEAIFDGELFSEFVLLYRLLHVSRFAVEEGAAPSTCWLEKWRAEAITSGVRALEQLRRGVQEAITTLGTGFLRYPDNQRLREDLDVQEFHNALLRLVYRLLFLFVAEDRDALHPPGTSEETRERYERYFSSARLRAHSRRRRGTAHADLYQALRIVLDGLGDVHGRPEIGLPGLGGIFDDRAADAPLRGLSLANEYLLTAVRHLCQVRDTGSRRWRSVDYRHLDAEELGSIYESLLELVPRHSAVDRSFELVELPGNTRKTTGSYYTPSSLIECLLDSALDPVIDDAVKRGEVAATAAGQPDPSDTIVNELLSLTVCDPACGSGHFLVAAARRIGKRVAAVRERNPEPTLDAVRTALHEVIARCIYGVDLNPMAVELAKVSLWLEALEPGKPLSFLDAHIKHGNALIGATPALLKRGIPDEAFKPIEGDDKKHAKNLEKQNAKERVGQGSLFDLDQGTKVANTAFAQGLRRIADAPSDDLGDVRQQESAYRAWEKSAEYVRALHVADAWCAAFMWRKTADAPTAVTYKVLRALENPEAAAASQATHHEIVRLREQYRFFHWHLEFPEIFKVSQSGGATDPVTGWACGFDCLLGNPPWDQVQVDGREFFAIRRSDIAEALNLAARNRMIRKLEGEDPELFAAFVDEKRKNDGFKHFVHSSARFPLTAYGRLNTYSLFAEHIRSITKPSGHSGQVVPSGIATDSFNQHFFNDLVISESISAFYDFENRDGLFPAVHSGMKFAVLSLARGGSAAKFAFFLRDPAELGDADRVFTLTRDEIGLLNPNSGTCPIFRSRRDAEINLGVYRKTPIFIRDAASAGAGGNPWGVKLQLMFMMSSVSEIFADAESLRLAGATLRGNNYVSRSATHLPLYEAKMVGSYDHRAADVKKSDTAAVRQNQPSYLSPAEHEDPNRMAIPMSWVSEHEVVKRIGNSRWLAAFCDVTSPTNERTVIASMVPRVAAGDTLPVMICKDSHLLVSNFNSFAFDYLARQKVAGLHLRFTYVKQLPVIDPAVASVHREFIEARVLELTYTAYDMTSFASGIGDTGSPFVWNEQRRRVMRAELDALYFHLYGISRDDVNYIMEAFPIVKRKDEVKCGTYRTKELVLIEYDRMADAGVSLSNPLVEGKSYTSTLTPAPGFGPRHTDLASVLKDY